MTGRRLALLITALALLIPGPAEAALGPFAPGFGRGGKLSFGFGEGPEVAALIKEIPGGGYVMAGTSNGAAGEYALIRISSTGVRDQSFGSQGVPRFFPPGGGGPIGYLPQGLAQRPFGFVTAGADSQANGFVVIAHDRNGALDPNFGTGGYARIDLGGAPAAGTSVASLDDGGVRAGGWVVRADGPHAIVAGLTRTGQMDPTWGTAGVVDLGAAGSGRVCGRAPSLRTLIPRPDGTLWAVGTSSLDGHSPRPFVARLTHTGELDPTFGARGAGYVHPVPDTGAGAVAGAVTRGEGLVVGLTVGAACASSFGARHSFGALAVRGDGTLDRRFGGDGRVTVDFPGNAAARGVAKLRNGRTAIVGGTSVYESQFAIAELTSTGRLARDFGGGRTCSEIIGFGQDGPATAVVGLNGGRIVVGGASQSDSESLIFARYRESFTPGGV